VLLLLCLLGHPGAPHELRELDAELRRHPDQSELYVERAEFLRTIARYDDALTDLDVAEALGAEVDAERAQIHEMRGEPLLAEYFASQALLLDPEAHVFFLRGRVREQTGRLDAALADYRAALAVAESVELFAAEARVLIALGRIAEARAALEEAIRTTGAVVLRRELIRIAEPEAALHELQVVLQSARVKTDWLLLRAEVLAKLGRQEEAAEERKAAVIEAERIARRRPAPAILLARARAYEAVGRTEEARRDRREAAARWRR
jgi:tetratricopeptide (TPR) repeat protein